MPSNYYEALGLKRTASENEIRQAYRRLARKYHPDVNRSDPGKEDQFKQINEAYQVLSNKETRRNYDQFGDNWKHADRMKQNHGTGVPWTSQTGFTNPGDLLGMHATGMNMGGLLGGLFGGQTRTSRPVEESIEHRIEVTLEEAYQGTTRVLSLAKPNGTRRRLQVAVPKGVDTGSRIRISTEERDSLPLVLIITVQPHSMFQRKGPNLYIDMPVPLYDSLLGGEIEVPTLHGFIVLKVPPETPNGKTFRLSGKGMPVLGKSDDVGDLFVTVKVKLPDGLADGERALFQQLKDLRG
jgi:curved DNA-binding protein